MSPGNLTIEVGLKKIIRLILFKRHHILGLYQIRIGRIKGRYLWIFLNKFGWLG